MLQLCALLTYTRDRDTSGSIVGGGDAAHDGGQGEVQLDMKGSHGISGEVLSMLFVDGRAAKDKDSMESPRGTPDAVVTMSRDLSSTTLRRRGSDASRCSS